MPKTLDLYNWFEKIENSKKQEQTGTKWKLNCREAT